MFENIEVNKPNFCIGPQAGTFCSVDTGANPVVMYVKNDSGALLRTYTFTPTSIIDVEPYDYQTYPTQNEFVTIQYVGPYNQTSFFDGAIFYTLERQGVLFKFYSGETSDYYTDPDRYKSFTIEPIFNANIIRRWRVNASEFTLELVSTVVKNSTEEDWFDAKAFAIQHTVTTFAEQCSVGTGQIEVTTTSGLKKYDTLILGPSNDESNLDRIEEVYVHSINGTTVEIRTYEGDEPTKWEYMKGDSIIFLQDILLFSNQRPLIDPYAEMVYGEDNSSGTLYTLDQTNYGSIMTLEQGYIFTDITAATWNSFYNALSFVKNSNLIHMLLIDYEIIKSQDIHLIDPAQDDLIDIYDIDIQDSTIYKLQRSILQQQSGIYFQIGWPTYNYHKDTIIPYTNSVTLYVSERVLVSQGQSFITVVVRDQFGISLLNKNVVFSSEGDLFGYLTPLDGYMQTDGNGMATIQYDASTYYTGHQQIKVAVDGGNIANGGSSLHATTNITQIMYYDTGTFIPIYLTVGGDINIVMYRVVDTSIALPSIPAYVFPGGVLKDNRMDDWTGRVDHVRPAQIVTMYNLLKPSSYTWPKDALYPLPSGISRFNIVATKIFNDLKREGLSRIHVGALMSAEKQISNNFVSRALTQGHTASISLDQYVFIQEARPVMWSEKNNVDTDYWIRLRPFAASLDLTTLVIKIKEVSYLDNPVWVDITSLGTAFLFDAGGGLLGIDFIYRPENVFHASAIVYISIEVYDSAFVPNKIVLSYWFSLIADYRKPYIINNYPSTEAFDIPINTKITFDAVDEGEGVDIDSLEVFINGRATTFNYEEYSCGNYHITCEICRDFYYEEEVNVDVIMTDRSANHNRSISGWKFYCSKSQGPWFDMYNSDPALCVEGIDRNHPVSLQVYGINDTGINYESIRLEAGGKYRDLKITPIVYRLI